VYGAWRDEGGTRMQIFPKKNKKADPRAGIKKTKQNKTKPETL